MGRIGRYLLAISLFVVAVAMAQVSQKPLPGVDLPNTWTALNNFTGGLQATSPAFTTPTIGGETVSASPRGNYTVFLPGALTSTWTGSTWVLTKAITATQVRVQVKTAPSGCSPNAVVRIGDGVTNVDTIISAAANGGAIGTSWGATGTITVSILTAASGCGTSPADANFLLEYRTQ